MPKAESKRIGYMTGLTGETIKVEIIDETISGRFVIRVINSNYYGIGYMLVPKAEVTQG